MRARRLALQQGKASFTLCQKAFRQDLKNFPEICTRRDFTPWLKRTAGERSSP